MALQSIWTGTISFSLVAIPVQLVKAVLPGRVSFRTLHAKDYSPLSREMFCPEEEKIVPRDEIVRGFEIGPEKYIVVTDEELESLSPERSRSIEIVDFIDSDEVDPVYYDRPYYLVPSKSGEKAYGLLVEVMRRTNKAGIAKFVFGEREYLVLVRVTSGVLCLITLHYGDEILSDRGIVNEREGAVSGEKDRMAKTIRDMKAAFKPEKYTNERKRKIVSLLGKKGKKQAPVESPVIGEETPEGPGDLVAVLQESMRKLKVTR